MSKRKRRVKNVEQLSKEKYFKVVSNLENKKVDQKLDKTDEQKLKKKKDVKNDQKKTDVKKDFESKVAKKDTNMKDKKNGCKRKSENNDQNRDGKKVKVEKQDLKRESVVKEDLDSDFGIMCHPNRLISVIRLLNDSQRAAIREMGFGGLLDMTVSNCNIKLLRWLCLRFNGISRLFTIDGSRSFVVMEEDVADVFGLPVTDLEVDEYPKGTTNALLEDYSNRFSITNRIALAHLSEILPKMEDGNDDFKRIFVLFALSVFLNPTGNKQTRTMVMKSLENPIEIPRYNWSGYVLRSLCASSIFFKKNNFRNFSGCVYLLLFLYFHRLQWHGTAVPSTPPLVQHWSQDAVSIRSNLEAEAGFGQGKFVSDLFPISKKPVRYAPDDVPVDGGKKNCDEVHGKKTAEAGKEKEKCGDVPVNGAGLDDGHGQKFIKYMLSETDLKDSEIKGVAKDGFDEIMLQLKRDLGVVTSFKLSQFVELKKKVDESSASEQSDSQTFFEQECVQKMIDDIIARFLNEQVEKEMPSFNILTPEDDLPRAPQNPPVVPSDNDVIPPTSEKATPSCSKKVSHKDTVGDESVDYWEFEEAVNSVGRDILSSRNKATDCRTFWSIKKEIGYVSKFIVDHKEIIKPMQQTEREIVDYCFFDKHSKENECDDLCLACEVYLVSREDILSLYPNKEIFSPIITIWCLIINSHRFHKKSRFAFGVEHSVSMKKLIDITRQRDQVIEEKGVGRGRGKKGRGKGKLAATQENKYLAEVKSCESAILSSWNIFLTHNERSFLDCDLVFFPLGIHTHYVCLVVNFSDKMFQYVDNLKREKDGNDYMMACDFMIKLFKKFAIEHNHPKKAELDDYALVISDLRCHSSKASLGNDCGVFLMHHMMYFDGSSYCTPDLTKVAIRRAIRAQICSTIILHDVNTCRDNVLEKVAKFYKEKPKLFSEGIGWVPQRKN